MVYILYCTNLTLVYSVINPIVHLLTTGCDCSTSGLVGKVEAAKEKYKSVYRMHLCHIQTQRLYSIHEIKRVDTHLLTVPVVVMCHCMQPGGPKRERI